jgi:hypothetical protein
MPTSSFNLSDLDGSNGFVIKGINPYNQFGFSVSSAGDINDDGIDDLIIGAPSGRFSYGTLASSYIVFGGIQIGTGGNFDLSSLDGNNGFALNSSHLFNDQSFIETDRFGNSVSSAGDINSDGIADLIIGAAGSYIYREEATSYVVFGSSNVGTSGSIALFCHSPKNLTISKFCNCCVESDCSVIS